MAAGEQADQQFLDHRGLADDHLRKLGDDFLAGVVQAADGGRFGDGGLNDVGRASGRRA